MAIRVAVVISRPPEVIFEKLCDCEFVATYLHAAHEIKIVSQEKRGKGAKWIQHTQAQDEPSVSTHQITEVIPHSLVVMTSLDGLSTETFTFNLTTEGLQTKLTFTNEIKGKSFLARGATALLGGVIRNMMQKDLERFRDAIVSAE